MHQLFDIACNFTSEQFNKDLDQLIQQSEEMFLNMQHYMEYCQMTGYVTPQDWIEKHKHF